MDLSATGDPRRAKGKFPAANNSIGDRYGNASPRSDAAMIEEITSIGFEIVDVNRPTTVRNVYSKLMLFVAFAMKRGKPAIVGTAEIK
jgi:hypothetical protein